ncbi:MAG TPA: hypothetical protein DCG30_02905 [Ruminococcus sp.]|nr:hypothetical protein [Ruminococcus sp.]
MFLKKIYGIINSFSGILIIVLMILSFTVQMNYKGSPYADAVGFQDGWSYDTCETADIEHIDKTKDYIHKYISFEELNGQSLCFMSRNANFSVYIDDEKIYDFTPKESNRKAGLYGDYLHMIPIPHFKGNQPIKIQLQNLDSRVSVGFYNMVLQNSGSYLSNIAQTDKANFFICLITFTIGFIIFVFGIIEQASRGNMVETMCLGSFTMLISVWTVPKPSILLMLAGNSSILRCVEYISLAILPIPVLTFTALVTKRFGSPISVICISSATLNLFAQLVLSGADVFDYTEMLKASHAIILMSLVCIITLFSSAYRTKELYLKNTGIMIAAISLIMISGMVDMIRYYTIHGMDSAKITRLSMPVFITALTFYEIRKLINFQIKSGEAELMEKLAMEDSLTGIKNRNAFNSYEKKLLKRDSGTCIFIHFDVNRLKKVNDNYGHAEGDRHIKAAADVIRKSFGNMGECFRVGGDEFFVILEGRKCKENCETGIKNFLRFQEEYNFSEKPPVPLEMAYGTAEYDCSMKNPEAAESLADSRMYEKKRLMKANGFKKNINGTLNDIKPPEFIHSAKKIR